MSKTFLEVSATLAALAMALPVAAVDRFPADYTYRVVGIRSDVRGVVAGQVSEIDAVSRRVTVVDVDGMGRRFKAKDSVKVLELVKVSDDVVVEYVRSVRVYEKVPGAQAPPNEAVAILDADVWKTGAAEGLALAGSGTATVESVDPAARKVVFRGSDGHAYPVVLEDQVLLKGLAPGKVYDFHIYEAGAVGVTVKEKPVAVVVEPKRAKLVEKRIQVDDVVYFAVGKADIDARSFELLNDVATIMKSNPQVKRLRIEGNASKDRMSAKRKDGAAYNRKLSDARAAAVKDHLVKQGVEASRLESVGYGWDRPVAPNDTEEGRARNRRTDFVVVEQ